MTIRNKTKKKSSFLKVYIIVFSILLALIAAGLVVLWFAMSDMEKNNPESMLNPIVSDLENKNYDSLFKRAPVKETEFETDNAFKDFLVQNNTAENITFVRKIVADSNEYLYVFKCGDKKIANVTIRKTDGKSFFGNEQFRLESLSPVADNSSAYTITAPEDAKVSINGKELNNSYITKKDIAIEELQYVPSSVQKKTLVQYTVDGLINEPQVTAKGFLGNDLKADRKEEDNKISFSFSYDGAEQDAKQYNELITQVSQAFAMHVTDDLSFTGVAKYLAKDSPIYDIIRRTEFYWYTPHDKFEFKNIQYSDYREYSEDCFSYRISFDHYVYRIKANVTSHKECDYTFVFAKVDDKWLVYDMTINSK